MQRDRTDPGTNLRRRLLVSLVSLVLALVAFGSAWLAYRGYPPPLNRIIWGAFALALFGFWTLLTILAAVVTVRTRRLPDWHRTHVVLEFGTFTAVMGVIWLFMPWGSTALQHVTLLFATSFCVVTALTSADEDAFTRWRILAVMMSLAAVSVIGRIALWPYLTVYLLILTAVLVVLDRLIRATILELREARFEAVLARDGRTRFIAAAVHDLGQPLQAARLFHEQAVRAPRPADRLQAAAAARDAFEAMERLLHAMLDHLRLSEGSHVARREEIAVRGLIEGVVGQYSAAAALRGVDLRALPTRALIVADRQLCERILGNFVDNALRHSQASRVRVAARRRPQGGWRLLVADDGRGLGESDPDVLFEDYTQGTNPSEGGFGLGLSSTLRAARLMNARVGVDPSNTGGAHFWLEFEGAQRDAPERWGHKSDPA